VNIGLKIAKGLFKISNVAKKISRKIVSKKLANVVWIFYVLPRDRHANDREMLACGMSHKPNFVKGCLILSRLQRSPN
jgi:hypothetical protein